uniref:Putative secreted protein n=1 Tax=Ixodes ricinus TaxID=34613 RepID=A0A6B0UIX2_IXORI
MRLWRRLHPLSAAVVPGALPADHPFPGWHGGLPGRLPGAPGLLTPLQPGQVDEPARASASGHLPRGGTRKALSHELLHCRQNHEAGEAQDVHHCGAGVPSARGLDWEYL